MDNNKGLYVDEVLRKMNGESLKLFPKGTELYLELWGEQVLHRLDYFEVDNDGCVVLGTYADEETHRDYLVDFSLDEIIEICKKFQ